MAKVTIMQLGEGLVTDNATGMKGMLTHCQINPLGNTMYVFQPKGLNPETGHPVERIYLDESRIQGGKPQEIEVPTEVLGTEVEDLATGLVGKAIALVVHLSGCVHCDVQPTGKLTKTGSVPGLTDIDIRRLKGVKVPKLTKAEKAQDRATKPSPMGMPRRHAWGV